MTVSETLKVDIEAYAARFRSSSQLFRQAQSGEITPITIARYIAGLRQLLRHTDINMTLARRRSEELGRTSLAEYFRNKATEEHGHDRWADVDMTTLNRMFGVTLPAGSTRSIDELLNYLHEMILEEPAQYLAYILFVEYVTVLIGPEWLQLLEERCSIPVSAMTVVGKHVELDKDHAADGLRQIDLLVDGDQNIEQLREALRTSMYYFDGFCGEVSGDVH